MKMDKESIIKQYEESGKICYECSLNGDYRKGNREAKKLVKIFKFLETNPNLADEVIDYLIKSDNIFLKMEGLSYNLALKKDISESLIILEELSKNNSIGIYRLNAEMTLKVWKENGYLKIYQQ